MMVTPDLLNSEIGLEGTKQVIADQQMDKLRAVQPHVSGRSNNSQRPTLAESVKESVEKYISTMGEQDIANLYELVLSEVEAPLLESVLKSTSDNQSKTAQILGLNRGTLRKKLLKYGML